MSASPPRLAERLRRIDPLDWVMLALALLSVGLLSWETWGGASEAWRTRIVFADLVFCAIFAVEFAVRWSREGWSRRYLARNWYEVLGMIPVAHPALRGFRLLRIVRVVVLLSRLGSAADRALGDEFTYRLLTRVQDGVVEAIGGAVTLYVLDEVARVLERGTYTRNIAAALAENRGDLEDMIVEKVEQDPRSRQLRRLPFYDDLVRAVTRATLDVATGILDDPRTDELVADLLRQNLQQIREAVRQDEQARGHLRQRP
ncbi:MAG: ion transporter [Nevskiaceae bacterium]